MDFTIILGIFFSGLVGFGLMGLMFFSRRRGYDEPPAFVQHKNDEQGDDTDAPKH